MYVYETKEQFLLFLGFIIVKIFPSTAHIYRLEDKKLLHR